MTLHPVSYESFIRYCSNRSRRYNAFHAKFSRAGFTDPHTNNSLKIEHLRGHREDEAKLLGYNNFFELSMATKMAGSVDNVKSFIQT